MSQIPIPLLGVTSTAAQFKFATSTDTSAGAVRIEYSGAGAGLFIRSTGATAYYPPAIILSNAAYGTESRITTASDNGILFQSNTPASWVFTASFSGAQSVARIKSTTAAVSDTGVLEIDTGYAAQAGIRVKLAATPTADAFQVYASDGTTKLASISSTGIVVTPTVQGMVDNLNLRPAGVGNIVYLLDGSGNPTAYAAPRSFNLITPCFATVTPSVIGANQNNYSLNNANGCLHKISASAAYDITGISMLYGTAVDGEYVKLINTGSFNITLKHENASSGSANRLLNSTGADIVLAPNQAAELLYDTASSRWRVYKNN